ncbi:MAG: hypothetical protein M3P93_04360 [Actinomycetota bacterium]|nr:hypothetical protein [Actinomycetota bacterium]
MSRIAKDQPPTRDAQGRSLPSHRDLEYVELRIVCRQHEDETVLAQFFVESQAETFDSEQVNERANKAVVERQLRTDPNGSQYLRYVLACPRCSNRPVLRQDTIDAALAEMYEQGAVEKVRTLPL